LLKDTIHSGMKVTNPNKVEDKEIGRTPGLSQRRILRKERENGLEREKIKEGKRYNKAEGRMAEMAEEVTSRVEDAWV
jgi:hypothetical protein